MNLWTRAVGAMAASAVVAAGLVAIVPVAPPAVGAVSASTGSAVSTPASDVTSIPMSPPALSVPVLDLKPGAVGAGLQVEHGDAECGRTHRDRSDITGWGADGRAR